MKSYDLTKIIFDYFLGIELRSWIHIFRTAYYAGGYYMLGEICFDKIFDKITTCNY